MTIKIPIGRAYYTASPNEDDTLLCWIPPTELEAMVRTGHAPPKALADYPDGIEVEVDDHLLGEEGIDLGFPAGKLVEGYVRLREQKRIDPSGQVDAAFLEGSLSYNSEHVSARGWMGPSARSVSAERLPPPKMSRGESADNTLERLARRKE